MDTRRDEARREIEAARAEIARINERIDAWNRDAADDPTAHAEENAKAVRDKAALELRILEIEARLQQLDAEEIAAD